MVEPKQPKNQLRRCTKNTHQLRDRAEWIEIPNATPPIISPEVFEAAQLQLKRNRERSPRNRRHQYLLNNGRLRCGVCGHAMTGSARKKGNKELLSYRCVRNVKSSYYERCPQSNISANKIEPLVWDEVAKVLKNPELVLSELSRLKNENLMTTIEADQYIVEGELRKLRQEQERYLRQYGQGNIDETLFIQENARVKKRQEELEAKLKKLQDEEDGMGNTLMQVDKAMETAATIADRLDNADYETKQLALDALDIRVIPGPDGTVRIAGSIPTSVELTATTCRPCDRQLHPRIPFGMTVSR